MEMYGDVSLGLGFPIGSEKFLDFFLAQVLDFVLAFFPGTICLVFATVWN
jgi:hypothetical protein